MQERGQAEHAMSTLNGCFETALAAHAYLISSRSNNRARRNLYSPREPITGQSALRIVRVLISQILGSIQSKYCRRQSALQSQLSLSADLLREIR